MTNTSAQAVTAQSLPLLAPALTADAALSNIIMTGTPGSAPVTQGWITLGAWYQTFATANQRLASIANQAPSVTLLSSIGESGPTDLYQRGVMAAYKTNLQNTTYTPISSTSGVSLSKYEMDSQNAEDPNTLISKLLEQLFVISMIQGFINTLNDDTSSPLITIKRFVTIH